jgi:hypothetical protein
VYGADHSPWVQAVLLGLHLEGIAHTLVTLPPLRLFLRSGVLMPAAKIDDGPWQLDSGRILAELGFSEVPEDLQGALQRLFLSGAMRRTDGPWTFWKQFSFVRDDHPLWPRRLWNHFWRSFSVFYFFTVIRIAGRRLPPATPERMRGDFTFFQERLSSGAPFLGGATPDTADLQLFGLVQMCASIPGPSLTAIREDPALEPLREWIERMQGLTVDYEHLYSATLFDPKGQGVSRASSLERTAFWCGAASMWLAFPVTLAAVLYFAARVQAERARAAS